MLFTIRSKDGLELEVGGKALLMTNFGDLEEGGAVPVDAFDAATLRPFIEALQLYADNGRDLDAFSRIVDTHAALGVSLYSMVRVADFFGMTACGDFFQYFTKIVLDKAGFSDKAISASCAAFVGGPSRFSTEILPRRFKVCPEIQMPLGFSEFNDTLVDAPSEEFITLSPKELGKIIEKKIKKQLVTILLKEKGFSVKTLPCGSEMVCRP